MLLSPFCPSKSSIHASLRVRSQAPSIFTVVWTAWLLFFVFVFAKTAALVLSAQRLVISLSFAQSNIVFANCSWFFANEWREKIHYT
jgi:hypothetical protein